jgi:hypothetical protein
VLEIGIGLQAAKIASASGASCTAQELLEGLVYDVQCALGSLAAGSSKTVELRFRALPAAARTSGVIAVVLLSAASEDATDPDDSNSSLIYGPDESIHTSIYGNLGGGKTTLKRIRAHVLIAPEAPQRGSGVQRYRRVEVFNAPAGSRVSVRLGGRTETGTANRAGKLRSRSLVNRPLRIGAIFSVTVTKPGRIGDQLRIKVISAGAKLAGRGCIPPGSSTPRSSCG